MHFTKKLRMNKLKGYILVIVLLLISPLKASSEMVKVFLMAGQSNMVGNCGNDQDPFLVEWGAPDPNVQVKVFGTANHDWGPLRSGLGSIETASGPEVAFGHAMANAFNGTHKVMIIKGAWSGTDLNVQWRPPSAGGSTGELYTSFVNNVKNALAEIEQPCEIVGMCWLQGESDCFDLESANAYESNLRHFISDLRKEFNFPGMLFSIAQIMEDPVYTHYDIVRAAQESVAEQDPLTGIFDPVGLPVAGAHWVLTACSAIGNGFAENLLSLLENNKKTGMAYSPWFPPTTFLTQGGCTWGMPTLGAYRSDNVTVIDQHIEWLADAGVDFILLDWSNNLDYYPGCNCRPDLQWIEDASDVIFDRMVWRKNNGLPWIKIAIMIGSPFMDAGYTDGRMDNKTNNIKERFIDVPSRRVVYYEHRGKPLLVDYCHGSSNYINWDKTEHEKTFTIRHKWATLVQNNMYDPQTMHSQNGLWSWSENVHPPAFSFDGRPEAVTIHAALRTCGWYSIDEDYPSRLEDCMKKWGGAKGRRNGLTLRESFAYARDYDVDLAMVMAFNEWTGCEDSEGEQRNPEYSIDIEPMQGGHEDLYLQILKEEIAKFKGYCALDTIEFGRLEPVISDSVFQVEAFSARGLPVYYSVFSGPAKITGQTVYLTSSEGTVFLKAYHHGDKLVCSAESLISFEIENQCTAQQITFQKINDRLVSREIIELDASSDSGLPVGFTVISGPAILTGDSTLQLTGQRGMVVVQAFQGGSFTFCKAESVTQSFYVNLPDHLCQDSDGYVTHEVWNGIEGSTVDLIPINSPPDYIGTLTALETPKDIADDYGVRLRGYLCAPYTGEYTFYIAGDDQNQLWLSNNEDPSGLKKIAYVDTWTPYRNWFVFESQISEPITLQGGNRYYLEVLLKEHKGGDHVSVRWVGPHFIDEIVSGAFLSPACKHQVIHFDAHPVRLGDSLFVMNGYASSGLPLTYELVSGNATMDGDTIHLLQNRSLIRVKAFQFGDEEFCYAMPTLKQFVLTVSESTNIPVVSNTVQVSIFPIPVKEQIFIKVSNVPCDFKILGWKIIDMLGRVIMVEEKEILAMHPVNASNITKGTYFFVLNTSHGHITKVITK